MRVCEIFLSILGEGTSAGYPCVILRLSGCNLRCSYCDTQYAWKEGVQYNLEQVMARVADLECSKVLVTGGEPLVQEGTPELIITLLDDGYEVFLETNGSLDISGVDERAVKIVDIKTPGSGESDANRLENIGLLRPGDQVKVVITGEEDYRWAMDLLREVQVPDKVEVLLSPCAGRLEPSELAAWMLRDRCAYRLQVQLHKVIWEEARGR